jgi:nicotinamidase-related amidase
LKTALLLIDIQQDYFPNGKMEVVNAVGSSVVAKKLLDYFRMNRMPVAHIQHFSTRPGTTFLIPETDGAKIHENVTPLADEPVIPKNYPNSFRGTVLDEFLSSKGIEQLIICGMMSHMCIDTTVRAAFDKGYTCLVAHDACATRNLVFNGMEIPAESVHASFMAALGSVFAQVQSADNIIKFLQIG